MTHDFVIIGAGASGLSLAAMLSKQKINNVLLEAHSLPGGSSSYFERDGFVFDAGATTLSGLKANRPLTKLFRDLELQPEIVTVDPGIIFSFEEKLVRRYQDHEKWVQELEEKFPGINHRGLWKKISDVEKMGWQLSDNFNHLPLRSAADIFSLLKIKNTLPFRSLAPLLNSVEKYFHLNKLQDENYLRLIDEMLFITSQNNRFDTPALMGAMGLNYPSDTSVMKGGMKAFVHLLADQCSDIRYRHKVERVEKHDGIFMVHTNHGTLKAKHVVSTIPQYKVSTSYWSAYMLYFTIPDQNFESLFYQIHCDQIPLCETHSFFVSLSLPQKGRRTVTISTHTYPQIWEKMTREEYKMAKNKVADFMIELFCHRLGVKRESLDHVITGSPTTFKRYTHRPHGHVGGIPHSLKRSLSDVFISRSPYQNYYYLGDTQFPGQGIASVVLGSQNLLNHLGF